MTKEICDLVKKLTATLLAHVRVTKLLLVYAFHPVLDAISNSRIFFLVFSQSRPLRPQHELEQAGGEPRRPHQGHHQAAPDVQILQGQAEQAGQGHRPRGLPVLRGVRHQGQGRAQQGMVRKLKDHHPGQPPEVPSKKNKHLITRPNFVPEM